MKSKGKRHQQHHRGIAAFFAILISLHVISPTIEIAAYELHKVRLTDTVGPYYGKTIHQAPVSPKELDEAAKETIVKEAQSSEASLFLEEESEVVEARSENGKTYQRADGSYVTQLFFEPIHKKHGDIYVEIDNSLSSNRRLYNGDAVYENRDGLYDFQSAGNTMRMENENGYALSITQKDADLSVYDVKQEDIRYSEIKDNLDLNIHLGSNRIETTYIINGALQDSTLRFTIEKGELQVKDSAEALIFAADDTTQFVYVKPMMQDHQGLGKSIDFSYQEHGDTLEITLSLDEEWINDAKRTYPIQVRGATQDQSNVTDISCAYNRSMEPWTTSIYNDLFVGYDDGSLSGNHSGITRTYLHIADLGIGKEKEIISADLYLWKKIYYAQQWNTIAIGKTSAYVDPHTINWNNKPSVSAVSTTNVRSDAGYQGFDITAYAKDLYAGKNNTLELKATNETSSYWPNCFKNVNTAERPYVVIAYRDAYDVKEDLEINSFDSEMRIFSVFNRGFEAMSFDGIAKSNSTVEFQLVKRGESKVIKQFQANSSYYFMDPIYITKQLANTQTYPKANVNYTTDYITQAMIPQYDVPYEYIVRVKNGTQTSTKEYRSDAFIKYQVKSGDNLARIAAYYGIEISEIKRDNNLAQDIVKEHDTLILRIKKDNPKLSADLYTPPMQIGVYQAKYQSLGANCTSGVCDVIDPINATTGNFYYAASDYTLLDLQEYTFTRYYNSITPKSSNLFGNGFTTEIESYLSYDAKGNMLYVVNDGRIYRFAKQNGSYQAQSSDRKTITQRNNETQIYDWDSQNTYLFDRYGTLTQIKAKSGWTISVHHDTYGRITEFLVGNKRVEVIYNEIGLVKELRFPDGAKTQYRYDAKRNLISFSDAMGHEEHYTYDTQGNLVKITDKNGNIKTQNTYDTSGRVIKQIDGNGHVSTLRYTANETILEKADGQIERYQHDLNYDTTAIWINDTLEAEYTYDAYRNIIAETNSQGETTRYTYDKGNLRTANFPDGTREEYQYDAQDNVIYRKERNGAITNYTYQGNQLETKSDENDTITYHYDAQGRLREEINAAKVKTTYVYQNNRISEIRHDNALIETFAYDASGRRIAENDTMGKQIRYIYNANGEMIQKNYGDGSKEQWRYDGNGNIIMYQDRIGGVTHNRYDQNNHLIESTKGSLTKTWRYNEVNQLVEETDEQGRTTTYTYDEHGNQSSMTDCLGNTTRYEYDSNDHLIKTIDALGNEEVNEYKGEQRIRTISKEGLTTEYEYDGYGREIKRIEPNGNILIKIYDGQRLSKESDSDGTIIEHIYDHLGREIKTITTYADKEISIHTRQYDAYGDLIEENKDGSITTYSYDAYHRPITIRDALSNVSRKEYDIEGRIIKEIDPLGYTILSRYDGEGNLIGKTDANGNEETYTYNKEGQLIAQRDALGYQTLYTYNDLGQLKQMEDPYQTITTYEYDQAGRTTAVMIDGVCVEETSYDVYGNEIEHQSKDTHTTSQYDRYGRMVAQKDEINGLSTYWEYDAYGNVCKESDSEGRITLYEYDERQRKIKTIDAYGREELLRYDVRNHIIETKQFDSLITSSRYDIKGNEIETTDALGNSTKKYYDENNRLVLEENKETSKRYTYDANGRRISEENVTQATQTLYRYDGNGNKIETIDALGNSTKQEFDEKNRVIAQMDALGNKTIKEYDAYDHIICEIDPLGNRKQSQYNAFGLLIMDVDERGFATTYTYDSDLRLIGVSDALGNKQSITYNKQGQKVKETDPNGGVHTYEYDAYGRIIKEQEPNGKITTRTYDVLDQVVKETSGVQVTRNRYDERGRLIETSINDVIQKQNIYDAYNQLVKTKNALGQSTIYRYDDHGREIYNEQNGYEIVKEYDQAGRLIHQVENRTLHYEYEYDVLGRRIQTKRNNVLILQLQYDANGNEISKSENGLTSKTTYDSLNRATTISVPSFETADEFTTICTMEYDESGNLIKITYPYGASETRKYDANHNLVEQIHPNQAISRYEYDGLNHLIKAQNNEERYVTYTYDEAGDQIRKTINNKHAEYRYDENHQLIESNDEYGHTNVYVYDAFGNRIEWIKNDDTSIHYEYDALGNKIKENGITYTYDERNNLIEITNEQGTITNRYDAFHQIIETTDTLGQQIYYVYDNNQNLIHKRYAGIQVDYGYDELGRMMYVSKDGTNIAQYTYNHRNELITIQQGEWNTTKTYDDLGRVTSQLTKKQQESYYHAQYRYDANDNLIEETINGLTNTYEYNAYDELIESVKYKDNIANKTTYHYDLDGNQITQSNQDGTKTVKYNDENQIEQIITKEGITYLSYDENGNLAKVKHADGQSDTYTYNEFNQLTKYQQGDLIYTYRYDGQKERIEQKIQDTKEYHKDVWYDETETIVEKETLNASFDHLKQQVETQGQCDPILIFDINDSWKKEITNTYFHTNKVWVDEPYYKEEEVVRYLTDRNTQYSEVLASNEEVQVYGMGLIESDQKTILRGWNEDVIAEVKGEEITQYEYKDYGESEQIQGHGYRSEMKDKSGLIYLRARYYDPKLNRFIQIDNYYEGEETDTASQNRYAYTLNNPYKYVDKDGKSPFSMLGGGGSKTSNTIKNLINGVKQFVSNPPKTTTQAAAKPIAKQNKTIQTTTKQGKNVAKAQIKSGASQNQIKKLTPEQREVIKKGPKITCGNEGFAAMGKGLEELGAMLGRNLSDAKDYLWTKIKQAGSIILEGVQNILSVLDDIMNFIADVGAFIVFIAGVVAVALTLGAAIASFMGVIGVETTMAVGAIGVNAGKFTLIAGKATVTASAGQIVTGLGETKLNGEALSEEEAKTRINRGLTNMILSVSGMNYGYVGMTAGEELVHDSAVQRNAKLVYKIEATHNPKSSVVVLGKFDQDGVRYGDVADTYNATYFQLEPHRWDEGVKMLGEEGMWDVNEMFLEEQYGQGKTFLLSHNPKTATGAFLREVQWLYDKGYHFIQILEDKGVKLWKAVK
ncbi:MAG: LysM peptidoglycan-binding domain-containing protein [Erysipelotrichaceae bacterium]|nr:LysM peptidoglycan-binding domain-containing protein [Erysipelotrichaceae bacterium]